MGLELVARADLKHAGVALDPGEAIHPRIQVPRRRIASDTDAHTARVNLAERLMIGDVEYVPAKLQKVLFTPGHNPRLAA